MADIPIARILAQLEGLLEPESARELLATVLAQLDLPVAAAYTPAEVMVIGAAIAEAQRSLLAGSGIPAAQQLEAEIGPIVAAIRRDAPHLGDDRR
ncbi:MAG: hypothetical protein VKP62_13845 [Candidatus Sericytochromatia bacterium]|nr:hypothetical protein [Candidatus Sericytochromatia bacterium]